MAFSAYIICATPRSGSTLLCDLLTGSGVAGQPDSYLRPQDIGEWAEGWGIFGPTETTDRRFNQAYLAAMKRVGTAKTAVFGLRLMQQSIGEATARFNAALGSEADFAYQFEQAFGATLFIHLSRQDKLAQAVSLVRAQQTGLWHVAADGSERERTAPARAPIFDADQITRARDMLTADDAAWLSFFKQRGIEPLRLTYETLAAAPQATLSDVLAALGCDRRIAADARVQTAKMGDAISKGWAERMKPE